MELFKSVEDKVLYVETLTCLATAGEKVTEGNKMLVYNILNNYGLPQDYADRIWRKIRQKNELEDILTPMKEKDMDIKLLLIQELIMTYLASGKYHQEKARLIKICTILNINIKLESLKERVVSFLKERQDSMQQTNN